MLWIAGIHQRNRLLIGGWQEPDNGARLLSIWCGLTVHDFELISYPTDPLFEFPFAEHHKRAAHATGGGGVQRRINKFHGGLGISSIAKRRGSHGAIGGHHHQVEPFASTISTKNQAHRGTHSRAPLINRVCNEPVGLMVSRIRHASSLSQ